MIPYGVIKPKLQPYWAFLEYESDIKEDSIVIEGDPEKSSYFGSLVWEALVARENLERLNDERQRRFKFELELITVLESKIKRQEEHLRNLEEKLRVKELVELGYREIFSPTVLTRRYAALETLTAFIPMISVPRFIVLDIENEEYTFTLAGRIGQRAGRRFGPTVKVTPEGLPDELVKHYEDMSASLVWGLLRGPFGRLLQGRWTVTTKKYWWALPVFLEVRTSFGSPISSGARESIKKAKETGKFKRLFLIVETQPWHWTFGKNPVSAKGNVLVVGEAFENFWIIDEFKAV